MGDNVQDAGLTELRRRYPWPDECPTVAKRLHSDGRPDGWCTKENISLFRSQLDEQTQIVVELGSWLGRSASFLLEAAPNATIICIDHWKGSSEHHRRPDWRETLPVLYETFLMHLWDHRRRVVPMKTGTLAGMADLVALSIRPTLVYVDASHETHFVCQDLTTAVACFPAAFICGDDWCHASVEQGVMHVVRAMGIKDRLRHGKIMWWLA